MRLPGPRVILGTNLVVAVGALAWVLWWSGRPALAVLAADPSWALLAAFAAMAGGLLVAYAVRWWIVLGRGEGSPALGVLVLYGLAGQSVSMLVPSGRLAGDPVRAYLLVRHGSATPTAIAGVAIDRVLDMGAGTAFAIVFALVLLGHGVPALAHTLVGVVVTAFALLAGVWVTVRRLQSGRGVVTALVRSARFDRLAAIERRMATIGAAEEAAARLVGDRLRMASGFACGLGINLGVLLEYHLLLAAFGLPADLVAVVGAIFAAGAAHSMPVPAGVGVLEGSAMVVFTALGYAAEIGLAVGLALRLRELVWMVPGLVYLVGRGLGRFVVREAAIDPSLRLGSGEGA